MKPNIILASSSTARRELLTRLQLPFTIHSPDIDETPHAQELAHDLVIRLAKEKALAVASNYPQDLIIAADQVGTLAGCILTKPLTYDNAFQQIKAASGKCVTFYTGMCLYLPKINKLSCTLSTYQVFHKKVSDETIKGYLQQEQPYQCAGSLHIEGLGVALVERMQGDDYTALIGLPLMQLTSLLPEFGVRLF